MPRVTRDAGDAVWSHSGLQPRRVLAAPTLQLPESVQTLRLAVFAWLVDNVCTQEETSANANRGQKPFYGKLDLT